MTKQEIRDIVEAIWVSNIDFAAKTGQEFVSAMKGGMFAQGLQFSVEADEVRALLGKRAAALRANADASEGMMPEVEKAIRKQVAEQSGMQMPGRPPIDANEQVAAFRAEASKQVAALRANAERLEWQAKHLQEKQYVLCAHDVDQLLPEERAETGYPRTGRY